MVADCWTMANLKTAEAGQLAGKPSIRGLLWSVHDAGVGNAGIGDAERSTLSEKEDFQAVSGFFASVPERILVLKLPGVKKLAPAGLGARKQQKQRSEPGNGNQERERLRYECAWPVCDLLL